MSEIESTDPETRRRSIIDPLIYEGEPVNKINNITSKRFKRRITIFDPELRNLVINNLDEDFIKIIIHTNFSINSLNYIGKTGSNNLQESIISEYFLLQYSVHTLFK